MAAKKTSQDYGAKLMADGKKGIVSLNPFVVSRVTRTTAESVRLLGVVLDDDQRFAATADVSVGSVSHFLAAATPDVALGLKRFLAERFSGPDSLVLPQIVTVQLVGKLGSAKGEDGSVPVKALSIAPTTTPESEVVKADGPEVAPVPIDPDEELVVLQMSPAIKDIVPGLGLLGIVSTVLLQCLAAAWPPAKKKAWTAYIASRPHYQELTLWVGLSESIPLEVIDTIQQRFELMGTEVGRELSTPRREEMTPLVRIAGRDIFLLVPEAKTPWLQAVTVLSGVVMKQGRPQLE